MVTKKVEISKFKAFVKWASDIRSVLLIFGLTSIGGLYALGKDTAQSVIWHLVEGKVEAEVGEQIESSNERLVAMMSLLMDGLNESVPNFQINTAKRRREIQERQRQQDEIRKRLSAKKKGKK